MEAKCQKCGNFFQQRDIFVTYDGFYCPECIPEDASKRFISLDVSWVGLNALLDYIDGNATVEQLMIIDSMTAAIRKKMMAVLKEMISKGGEVQESDSEPLGTGDD